MRKEENLISYLDWPLFISFLLMLIMGLATVYSVAYTPEDPSLFDLDKQYGKQSIWIGISLFLGLLVFLIDSDIYRKFAFPIYLFTLLLLVIVLFMPAINGARAWIGIGSMGIQPAEFSKIASSLLIAKYISELSLKQQTIASVSRAIAIILVPMILILLQPDAGTFVVFTSFLFVMYREGLTFDPLILSIINKVPGFRFKYTWVGSHFIPILFVILFLSILTLLLQQEETDFYFLPFKVSGSMYVIFSLIILSIIGIAFIRQFGSKRDRSRVSAVILLGLVLGGGLSYTVDAGFGSLAPHQKDRIELFLGLREDPNGKDYNRNRAMAAVGSGGFFGKGYNKASVSSVESNHVPESETDFIFCPFAEEWGFVGTLFLVALYLFMLIRIIFIAERQRSSFNRIYAYCVAMILFYHFAINIGMSIGFAPVIGIPLPFFSYGGSSMMSFSIMIFILLKLDSQRKDVLS
ncbi:MAG: rod shape-determining protein RodA [Flavobacteriia bacterium]|jgi:rod shape determining protein RodA|nr:rod shape-determining protein RodA [Flavobacteriia bacterium]